MTTVVPGVTQVAVFPYVNVFLIEDADGLTLVDTGLKSSAAKIRAGVEAIGRSVSDVRRVILTHCHADHAGSIARLRDGLPVEVMAGAEDAVCIEAGTKPPLDPSIRGLRRVMVNSSKPVAPTKVDRHLRDGDLLDVAGGTRVLHTPGHTPGHVSLLIEGEGLLITGDALFNVWGLRYPPRFFCSNVALSRETAEKFGDMEYDSVAFAHGRPLGGGARQRVREFLRKA